MNSVFLGGNRNEACKREVLKDYVIFLNKWWNPSSNYQARDRVVRIGQEKIVQVFNLFCVDTLEERVLDILEEKEEVYKNIVDGLVDEKYVSNLIEDEILN